MNNLTALSDLHLEFFKTIKDGYPHINPLADIIILSGDIANGINSLNFAIDLAQKMSKPVIWVAGNHEYYRQDIGKLSKQFETMSNYAEMNGVYCLEYLDSAIINNIRFIGSTLWTDCKLYEGAPRLKTQQDAIEMIGIYINDFRIISDGEMDLFTAAKSVALHARQYQEIIRKISVEHNGFNVLVTHHGVHKDSIAPKYNPGERVIFAKHKLPGENTNWLFNPGFASHLPELTKQFNLCIHGHTHESIFVKNNDGVILANPRGYPIGIENEKVIYENRNFDENLIINMLELNKKQQFKV